MQPSRDAQVRTDSSLTDRPITSLAALTALGIVYGDLFQHRKQLWLRLHRQDSRGPRTRLGRVPERPSGWLHHRSDDQPP